MLLVILDYALIDHNFSRSILVDLYFAFRFQIIYSELFRGKLKTSQTFKSS